jgi:RsiW-degrading membrane proteinase PrsW (M82 family)
MVEGAADDGGDLVLDLAPSETISATWDAPDPVWVGKGPANEVVAGVLFVVLGSVLPTLGFMTVIYWADRYEREPIRLLAAAFVWGAVPSVLLAAVGDLFFRLPFDLIGTQVLEAARLGLLAPVIQEAVKGAAVSVIAWRYRDEFDGVLDGIVYGATVGFGYAMTGNMIANLGRFIQWGPVGLNAGVVAEGVIQALDQGFYGAVFGAGLAFSIELPRARSRWAVRIGAFAAAAGLHLGHNLVASALVGLTILNVLVTLLSLVSAAVAIIWALGQERRVMRHELPSELPQELCQAVTRFPRRARVEWNAWRDGGLAGVRRVRRVHRLCAELAFAKSRSSQRPDDEGATLRVSSLREELASLVEAQPDAGRSPAGP